MVIHCFCGYFSIYRWNPRNLINLQYFLRFNLYILWNPWNPYYFICHFLFSSLWSVYKSVLTSGVRERIIIFVFAYVRNKLRYPYLLVFVFIYIVHLLIHSWHSLILWLFDLVCLDFNLNITFKSSVYCKSLSNFHQYFWGFHPWILLNPRIC